MQPTFFINHGGGPCFFLEGGPIQEGFRDLEAYLSSFAGHLHTAPKAVLVVSDKREEAVAIVNASGAPPLLYDYGGFPEYTYRLTWPAPDEPDVAARVQQLLSDAVIDNGRNDMRGWDHGVFVPFKVIWPEAQIPTVQLFMRHGWDPAQHLEIGQILRPLRDEGVLIVGSGQTYHNLGGGFEGEDPAAEAFDDWLRTEMVQPEIRDDPLNRGVTAPGARHAQPEEVHLLPLMVAAGAASGPPAISTFTGSLAANPPPGSASASKPTTNTIFPRFPRKDTT